MFPLSEGVLAGLDAVIGALSGGRFEQQDGRNLPAETEAQQSVADARQAGQ
jgi:hypothetical protein